MSQGMFGSLRTFGYSENRKHFCKFIMFTWNMKIVQTCYAKWLSICSGYYEFNALVYVHCVEWNCHYFFLFICRILVPVFLVLPYYMVNKDEYNAPKIVYRVYPCRPHWKVFWLSHTQLFWEGTIYSALWTYIIVQVRALREKESRRLMKLSNKQEHSNNADIRQAKLSIVEKRCDGLLWLGWTI